MSTAELAPKWQAFLADAQRRVQNCSTLEVRGTLTRLTGLVLEAVGLRVPVGSQCLVTMKSQPPVLAEVVGFSNDRAFLMPAGDVHGLSSGASVEVAPAYVVVPRLGDRRLADRSVAQGTLRLPLGDGLLGRVVDA
ncbi:MAG: flagellum-specific ATP synthase FliI, partial [Rhodoferax sp.]